MNDENALAQKQSLEKEFYDWKGANSQTDDILILGMKI
jgi:hypothetical protein